MHLLVNGCSCTWGLELGEWVIPDEETPEAAAYRQANAWGGRLAQKISANKHTNVSMPGASNHRIVRTTIRHITSMLADEWKDLFVVIGWSCVYRQELYMQQYKRWHNFLPRFNNHDERVFRKQEEFVQKYMMEEYPCHEHFYIHVITLQSFFEANNIKYMFFPVFFINWRLSDNFNDMKKHINPKHFVHFDEWQKSYHNILVDAQRSPGYKDKEIIKPRNHPSELGHEIWATRLEKEIKSRGIL